MKKLTTVFFSIPTIRMSTSCYEAFLSFDNFYINRSDLNIHHMVPQHKSIRIYHLQHFFGVESIMRVNAASLDIRDATTSTPGTLNDLTTDLIMANNNNNILKRTTYMMIILSN